MFQAERSGDTKRQKELETAFKYSSRLMAEGRKKEAAGVAKYYAAGKNVVDSESAMAMQNSAGAIQAISEGKQGEDVYQAGIASAKESAKRTAGTKAIGGDVSNQIGDFVRTIGLYSIITGCFEKSASGKLVNLLIRLLLNPVELSVESYRIYKKKHSILLEVISTFPWDFLALIFPQYLPNFGYGKKRVQNLGNQQSCLCMRLLGSRIQCVGR
jgi:hypothetical protein